MLDPKSRNTLNFRPKIVRVEPKSLPTIPNPDKSTTPVTEKETRVNNIIRDLQRTTLAAAGVEQIIHKKAKNIVVTLDLNNPEDAVVGQAAARLFPDAAREISGLQFVDKLTYPMYVDCLNQVKISGFEAATKNQIKDKKFDPRKTNFGGLDGDRRPQVNMATLPFEPLNLATFIAGIVPALFALLFPLINGTVKANIVGHTHPVVTPPSPVPVPSGPGIPLVP